MARGISNDPERLAWIKERMRAVHLGKKNSPEHNANISKAKKQWGKTGGRKKGTPNRSGTNAIKGRDFPELRYVVSNGKTVCAFPCHRDEHRDEKRLLNGNN